MEEPRQEDDSSMAFDLLGDDLGGRAREALKRKLSRSFSGESGRHSTGDTPPMKQRLLRIIHEELSILAAEADGVSEKVKRIINRQRRRLDGLIEETSKAPRRLQSKIAAPLDKRRKDLHGKIRKAVTGDPMKSVRLHLEEKRSKPFVMRMLDKAAFTVGVLTMIVSEYVLLLMPERFWLWYSVMVPVLLLMRYPDYRQRKWLFFYFDFCYYVQVLCVVAIFFMPHNCPLFKSIFIFTMGSLLWAVPLWRNSLVFHDVDKMTSCFIHLFPSWLAITMRWYPLDPMRGGTVGAEPECQAGIDMDDVVFSTGLYLLWQLLYYLKTEIVDKPKLDADPEIQTSLRWLTTSPTNPMHKVVLFLMKKTGLFKKDETFDPKTFKTKIIFMGSQLVFTVVVSLPTPFLYNSKWASFSLAFFVFLCALWNSSNYYIEVFSRRYWQSMEAESAAKAEALLLKAARQREREREGDGDGGGGGGNRRSKNLSDKLVGLMSSSSDLSGGGGGGDDDGEMAWGDGDGGGSGSGSGNVSRDEEEDEDLEEEEEEEDVVLENVDPVVDEAVEVAATAVAVAAEAEANGVVNTEISAMQPHKSKDV